MMWRLENMPVYSSAPTTVEADLYNLIRRAVLHSNEPIRITFRHNAQVDILIDEDSWTCVDNTNNDMPLVSWVEFEAQHRDSLHTPITCIKNYYHFAGGKFAAEALVEVEAHLTEHYNPAPVCQLDVASQKKKVWRTATSAKLSCV